MIQGLFLVTRSDSFRNIWNVIASLGEKIVASAHAKAKELERS